MAPKQTNWMARLQKLEGAVVDRRNVHETVIQTPSPSLNFIFGDGHGLPLGFELLIFGPPEGGKSLISCLLAGGVHRDYPEGIVMRFSTEFREAQLSMDLARKCGMDMDRYIGIDANSADAIFDQIDKQVNALCQEGMPLKLIIIDSLNGVQGRRSANAESVNVQQQGDVAATVKEGFKRILPIIRKHGIALVATSHVTPETDMWEQRKNGKYKMSAGVGTQHALAYKMYVEKDTTKAGKTDINGKEFVDESKTDASDKGDVTAGKIRFTMKGNTFGTVGRSGFLTWDYGNGVINIHEEVFLLGTGRNVIERPNNSTYQFNGVKWVGKDNFLNILKEDLALRDSIIKEIKKQDLAGTFRRQDAEDLAKQELEKYSGEE